MNRVARVGVDLAKNIMQRRRVDAAERVVVRKAVSRDQLLEWIVNRDPSPERLSIGRGMPRCGCAGDIASSWPRQE
ncbi:hypothetical protein LMG29542_08454 [Paraburkholderia humisilvae]|uniref:Uncharacterized protein n=1 Tax=Paraburkholderia humisilvae TaxID=627669 RepID=A0A6J5FBH1_9BURK|nr:hypothetical protein LMG29542_08454 [Paraburkholderia humisilvae]